MPTSKQHGVVLFILLLIFALAVVSCSTPSEEAIEAAWESSAHANEESRSFSRWNDEDPAEIPANCAKCHSTTGYHDFLGLAGSTAGQVDGPVPVGSTIECEACHNEVAEAKDRVLMPSGITIHSLGEESNCMECHQGRASSKQVNEAINGKEPDRMDEELRLPNIHNNAAGPTFYGNEAKGGGEYAGKIYEGQFYHGFDNCTTCHDPHALQVNVDNCSACHLGATTIEGVRNIRLVNVDYDGDGDIAEGLSGEVETMQQKLLAAMRLYTLNHEDVQMIVFENGRFLTEEGENYTTWTPRLLQASYNYQYVTKDPGAYSHNPRYVIQLMYDSIEGLGLPTQGMIRPGSE